jgi:hypothetical protein
LKPIRGGGVPEQHRSNSLSAAFCKYHTFPRKRESAEESLLNRGCFGRDLVGERCAFQAS